MNVGDVNKGKDNEMNSEIRQLESEISELIAAHLSKVKPLEARLKTLKRQHAASLAPDLVHGQKRKVTIDCEGWGDVGEVITIDCVCFAQDRADQDYLAVVVDRSPFGTSTFPAAIVRRMPIA